MEKHPIIIVLEKDSLIARFNIPNFFSKLKNVGIALPLGDENRLAKEAVTTGLTKSEKHKAYELIINALAAAIFNVLKKDERAQIKGTGSLINKKSVLEWKLIEKVKEDLLC